MFKHGTFPTFYIIYFYHNHQAIVQVNFITFSKFSDRGNTKEDWGQAEAAGSDQVSGISYNIKKEKHASRHLPDGFDSDPARRPLAICP